MALNELNVQRRVILSGTPVQNDLSEYFSLLNFANPGLLGSTAEFRKNYEIPILRGRDSEASDQEQEISNQKLAELSGVVSKFIIRRTNDILSKYCKSFSIVHLIWRIGKKVCPDLILPLIISSADQV